MHPICCNIGLDKSMYSMQINLISMKANEEINKHLINDGWLYFNSCYFAIWSCICCMLYGAWTICSGNIFLVQNISQNNFVHEDQWLTRPHPLPGCDPDSWWSWLVTGKKINPPNLIIICDPTLVVTLLGFSSLLHWFCKHRGCPVHYQD